LDYRCTNWLSYKLSILEVVESICTRLIIIVLNQIFYMFVGLIHTQLASYKVIGAINSLFFLQQRKIRPIPPIGPSWSKEETLDYRCTNWLSYCTKLSILEVVEWICTRLISIILNQIFYLFVRLIRTQLASCKVMGAINSLYFVRNKGKSDPCLL
jgi:hypothetical protein